MTITTVTKSFYDDSLYLKGHSPATIKRYKFVLQYYIRFAHIETLDDINEANVRSLFIYGRAERQWKPTTFLVFHRTLTVFFGWCSTHGYMTTSPLRDIAVPKRELVLPRKLTKHEAMKLLEVVYNYPYEFRFTRYRNHAMFSLFIFTGLRKSELLNLTFTDIDLEARTVMVRGGKGGKDRIIPLSTSVIQPLQEYLRERKRARKTCVAFFTSTRLNTAYTEHGLKRLVQTIRQVSAIPFTIHTLRHTFATLMLEGGCDIYSLSKLMGHSDIQTTTIYLAATVNHLRDQILKHPLNV